MTMPHKRKKDGKNKTKENEIEKGGRGQGGRQPVPKTMKRREGEKKREMKARNRTRRPWPEATREILRITDLEGRRGVTPGRAPSAVCKHASQPRPGGTAGHR